MIECLREWVGVDTKITGFGDNPDNTRCKVEEFILDGPPIHQREQFTQTFTPRANSPTCIKTHSCEHRKKCENVHTQEPKLRLKPGTLEL